MFFLHTENHKLNRVVKKKLKEKAIELILLHLHRVSG